jgi:hypothetical protein
VTISSKKEFAILGFVSLYTILFFAIAASFFRGQQEWSVSVGYILGITGIVWAACVALAGACLSEKRYVPFILSLVPASTLWIVGGFTIPALIGAGIVFLLGWSAQQTIAHELISHIKIRIATVFSAGVKMLLLGMFLSFIVLSIPGIREAIVSGNMNIPEEYITSIVLFISPVLEQTIPVYSPDKTIDEVLGEDKQDIAAAKDELSKELNIAITGKETGPVLIARIIREYVKRNASGDGLMVTVVVIAVAFIAVRTLVPIIAGLVLVVITALFWIMKKSHLIAITEREIPVQSIEI